jgi:hypothetical protein
MPAIAELPGVAKVSASGRQSLGSDFGIFVSGLQIPFPGNRDRAKQDVTEDHSCVSQGVERPS